MRALVAAAEGGASSIQQMLMGEGKTAAVLPLCVRFLADGERLVTVVVPSYLIPQTKACYSPSSSNPHPASPTLMYIYPTLASALA